MSLSSYQSFRLYISNAKEKLAHEYLQLLDSLSCETRCQTLIIPDDALLKKMNTLKKSGPVERKELLRIIESLQLRCNLGNKMFRDTICANGLGLGVKVSLLKKGEFSIETGVGYKTKMIVELAKDYQPDLKAKTDEAQELSVAYMKSGDIDTKGTPYTESQVAKPRQDLSYGGKENTLSEIKKVNFMAYLLEFNINGDKVSKFTASLSGLLVILLKNKDDPTFRNFAEIICTMISPCSLSSWYVIVRPLSLDFIPQVIINEWNYALSYIKPYPELLKIFSDTFDKTNQSARDEIVADLRNKLNSSGENVFLTDDVTLSYHEDTLRKIYGNIENYPYEEKEWCDTRLFCVTGRVEKLAKSTHKVNSIEFMADIVSDLTDLSTKNPFINENLLESIEGMDTIKKCKGGLNGFILSGDYLRTNPLQAESEAEKFFEKKNNEYDYSIDPYIAITIKLNSGDL